MFRRISDKQIRLEILKAVLMVLRTDDPQFFDVAIERVEKLFDIAEAKVFPKEERARPNDS